MIENSLNNELLTTKKEEKIEMNDKMRNEKKSTMKLKNQNRQQRNNRREQRDTKTKRTKMKNYFVKGPSELYYLICLK